MYCPQCATENAEGASFCRGCGSNISLVSQALTGSLQDESAIETDDCSPFGRQRKKGKGSPSIERGIKNIFMGLAFVLVAFAARTYSPGGFRWWFWLLIPAFTMLGGGVAEIARFKFEKGSTLPAAPQREAMPTAPARPRDLYARNTSELIQPPSVTEGTTRHLKTPVESKRKNS
jgi:hypothetical protein